jgi:hypothetical protein
MKPKPEVVLACSERRSPTELRIDYTITNQGSRPLYVYTCVARRPRQPLPHQAYTTFRKEDAVLELFLGLPAIPRGWRVYAKIAPYASLLRPGGRHVDYLEMSIPAREWQPYGESPEPDQVETVPARRLVLATEYFPEQELVRPAQWESSVRHFRALGARTRRVEATIELAEPLPVIKPREAVAGHAFSEPQA